MDIRAGAGSSVVVATALRTDATQDDDSSGAHGYELMSDIVLTHCGTCHRSLPQQRQVLKGLVGRCAYRARAPRI